jgi:hypothetical protein
LLFGFHVISEWFWVFVFKSFTNDVIYMVSLGFSELSFAFFLEMSVFFYHNELAQQYQTYENHSRRSWKATKNTNPSKAMEPDRIPNIILKTCAEELALCLRNIFPTSVSCVVHEYPDLNPWLRLVNILWFSKCLSMCLQIMCSSILQDAQIKDELALCLRNIFPTSVDCCTLPNDWLSANIAPVLKKGEVYAAENYR